MRKLQNSQNCRAFLQGYTRTRGEGERFIQILNNRRVQVWETQQEAQNCRVRNTRMNTQKIRNAVLYRTQPSII